MEVEGFAIKIMPPVRIRHPKGISTIDVPSDDTVQDFQQKIYALTHILPSRQTLKSGYPPRALTIVPELPFDSLGLQRSDQIIVSEIPNPDAQIPSVLQTQPLAGPVSRQNQPPLPAPIQSPPPKSQSHLGPDHVEVDGSFLIHRVVPDDNSCMFSSAALVFEQTMSKASDLRKIVADGIRSNPDTYNEAILGMPTSRYIAAISNPSTWGGAIELGILAAHYRTEIASIDVETGRIDYFSPGELGGAMRCILIYSGIHYDAASLAPVVDAPAEWHQTLFPVTSSSDSDPILIAAKKLATILREKKAFTNTSTFDLKCEDCGQGLKGEKEARTHAAETGHVRFGEY